MDLRQLRYFVAAAEEKSFLTAARRVNVSQPALSVCLKELEKQLNVLLFQRRPHGVELTDAGEVLLPHARSALAALALAEDAVRVAMPAAELVKLWAGPTPCLMLLPQLLEECSRVHPPLKLQVCERSSRGVNLLAQESINAALTYSIQPSPDVRIVPLYHEDLFLIGPPTAIEGMSEGSVQFQELSKIRLALYPPFMAMRRKIEEVALHYGMKLNVVADVEPANAMRAMMLDAGCCTIVPYPHFLREIKEGSLVARHICSPQLTMTLKLVTHSSLNHLVSASLLVAVRAAVARAVEAQKLSWQIIDPDVVDGLPAAQGRKTETVATTM